MQMLQLWRVQVLHPANKHKALLTGTAASFRPPGEALPSWYHYQTLPATVALESEANAAESQRHTGPEEEAVKLVCARDLPTAASTARLLVIGAYV